ncbi:uncharacterized protein PITG_14762 [Phytophthora infestans T30-4]|uniref:Uncharacterized protein n=1 Tax=Phytophthora infestans (strain T30-4) TaxID=403677 RepID=D0NR14_PHYIT|nr:uncharacterized protein PITG_14762 [Phytophthora infestans T30-4]EEY63112.1 conserved hypothetical protein [Phytophthora infestans T30-4]|eukprot:XP_002898635.1 conserved hypothetical protein [Phytophthora infestans T30-4]
MSSLRTRTDNMRAEIQVLLKHNRTDIRRMRCKAAECSHNTRTSETQTFAVFVTDHQYDGNNGYPYGTCSAYTCDPPTLDQMEDNDGCWMFFWR